MFALKFLSATQQLALASTEGHTQLKMNTINNSFVSVSHSYEDPFVLNRSFLIALMAQAAQQLHYQLHLLR